MRLAAAIVMLCAMSFGCQPAPETAEHATDTTSASAAPVAQLRLYPARSTADLPQRAVPRVDSTKAKAAGIVYAEFEGSAPAELTILNDTSHEVQTIARLRFYALPDGGMTDTLWVRRPDLFGDLERATHEHYGLQASSRHGGWARVNYAYDADGVAQEGWVQIVPGKVHYASYDSLMQSVSTDFSDPAAARFYDRPGGTGVRVSLEPSHALKVLEPRAGWIRIILTVPDTTECTGDPNATVTRRDTVWVPRVNASGRRQLVSAVAGC